MRCRSPILVMLAASCVSLPIRAVADNDGGVRSVFANGIGTRPLALGGAYASISNDANALMWNPGGLGLVERAELQFSQTSYYGVDLSEQYGAFVLPHWRWGVMSLMFRHFGAGGIEGRDNRNIVTDDDISNNETEILLGYGRRVNNAWSLGGSLKLRTHSLAGSSASGIGMDAGIVVHPLLLLRPHRRGGESLSLGLSVRNAIQPKIRLDQENVADPTGVRLGASYEFAVVGSQRLLASIDVERTQYMDTRFHGGVEYDLHRMLTLRMGLNNGRFDAGTAVQWRNFAIDYTFEQNDLQDVHWVGATFQFGRTVAEGKQVAMEQQENELQQRLTADFEQRQRERVLELLGQARTACDQGAFDHALEILAVVSALEPENSQSHELQAACWNGLGRRLETQKDYAGASVNYTRALTFVADHPDAMKGLERCRDESDRLAARSEKLRAMFANALDAFSIGNLVEASEGFAAILREAPDDAEAIAMYKRTQQAIDRRVNSYLDDAEEMIQWGRYNDAQDTIDEARLLRQGAARISVVQTHLDAERAKRKTRVKTAIAPEKPVSKDTTTDAVPTRALTESERNEAAHLYEQAVTALKQDKNQDAIRYLELVWSIDPNYQGVTEHLKREYINEGMEFFADGNFDKAVEYWENALRVDPSDGRTKAYLTRAREQASRTQEILGTGK